MNFRTFKFRIWDENNGTFRNPTFVGGHLNDILSNDSLYHFCQFTGLTDKTGRELYEGDIIKLNNGDISLVRFDEILLKWGLEYKDFNTFTEDLSQYKYSSDFEIIGNWFENKNLLKNKDILVYES